MAGFLLFPVLAALYIAFLLWCILPFFRTQGERGKFRLFVGLFFSVGAFVPVFRIVPLFFFGLSYYPFFLNYIFGGWIVAVAFFPVTLPQYALNLWDWHQSNVTIREIEFDFAVGGRLYTTKVPVACMPRRTTSIGVVHTRVSD